MTVPNFIIVGALKSGSTALARYLGDHPDAFMARQKEVHFFDRNFENGLEWYEEQFRDAGDAKAVGEATPCYMYDAVVVERMAEMLPDARLLAILRHPVDRAYSHYWHNRSRGAESRPFEVAFDARPSDAPNRPGFGYDYADKSHYLPSLERVSRVFPREQLRVLLFEELRDDPQGVYSDACRFLGVDDSVSTPLLGTPVNEHRTYRSLRLREAVVRSRLPRRMRDAIGRVNTKSKGYPPLESAVRDRLHAEFREEISELAGWLGRDLQVWDERPSTYSRAGGAPGE